MREPVEPAGAGGPPRGSRPGPDPGATAGAPDGRRGETLLRTALLLPILAWGVLVLAYAGGPGGSAPLPRVLLAGTWAGLLLAVATRARTRRRAALGVAGLLLPVIVFFLLLSPSNDRAWEAAASRTAHATVEGERVTLHDVRNFRYAPDGTATPDWYDATYDLRELMETWFILTEFGQIEGLAHVMVSFEFAGDRFVVFSVEIRREEGETYSPLGGALRQYELMYVAADERDAVALRTLVHRDSTWVIPMNAGRERNAAFFLDMVERMNDLHERPVWYHTLWNSCATNLARHYERVNDVRLGWDRRIFLPGFGDELLEELGLLPEGMDREGVRARFQVNARALADGGSPGFSRAIRDSKALEEG